MKRFALIGALLVAGLVSIPTTANAQDFRVGVDVRFGGSNHRHHGGHGHGRPHHGHRPPVIVVPLPPPVVVIPAPRPCPPPVYSPAPPCHTPAPVYHAPIIVTVTETTWVWEKTWVQQRSACGRYLEWVETSVRVERTFPRQYTAYWNADTGRYGYWDSSGTYHWVR